MAKKPNISTVSTGYQATDTINDNFNNLRNGFENTLSLDGSTPNAMNADLDMNGNSIMNADGLYVNGVDIFAMFNRVTISTDLPTGGINGDIWFKVSS
jgi:hypothetical protein